VSTVALLLIAVVTAAGGALRAASRIRLRHYVERREPGWPLIEIFLEEPGRVIAVTAATASLLAFVLGASLAAAAPDAMSLAAGFIGWSLLVILVGEVAPRAIARRWPLPVMTALLPVLGAARLLAGPLAAIASLAARDRLRPPAPVSADADGDDDLADVLEEGTREGVGAAEEMALVRGVVRFADQRAVDVMTPREQIFAVDAALPPRAMAEALAKGGYTRVPVVRGSLDDVAGMVLAFDVLKGRGELAPALRPVAVAAPDTPCNQLLYEMLRFRRHLAVVRDADGRTLGLVTLEDLLEELVGEIRDEHDEPPPRAGGAA
jgi:putative hemolysin